MGIMDDEIKDKNQKKDGFVGDDTNEVSDIANGKVGVSVNKPDNIEERKEMKDDFKEKVDEKSVKEDDLTSESINKAEKMDDEPIAMTSEEDKKPHHVHHVHHKHKAHGHIAKKRAYHSDGSGAWKFTSFVLFVVLIVSIFTNGFSGSPTPTKLANEVNKIALKQESDEVFAIAKTINDQLEQMESIIEVPLEEPIKKTDNNVEFSGDSVELEFYVMSQCPYGTQVENAIAPVLEELGDAVDFKLDYIANDNGDGTFQSLHGQKEVDGNIVQLCAKEYNPDLYMNLIVCMNKNAGAIPENWEKCAKDNNMAVESIKTCYEGDEGKKLHSESVARAAAAGARGSPTIFINGDSYSGARDSTSFKKALCTKLPNHSECTDLPACGTDQDCPAQPGKIPTCENPGDKDAKCTYTDDVAFEVIVINDKRCTTCDTSQLEKANLQYFPGASHRTVDASSEEGKMLIEKYGIVYAPTLLFEKGVRDTAMFKATPQFEGFFEDVGDYLKLGDQSTGATYFVNEEARQELYDSLGLNMDDDKPQIDFWVMSYCPYGNQAEEGIEPVFKLLGDKVEYNPRYVIYNNYAGGGPNYCLDAENKYCSMHGIQELHQDVRELCVNKYYGIDKWFEFALAMNNECTSQNADTCWENVAEGIDIDTEKIGTCEADEAFELLEPSLTIGNKLGVSGSPTVFIDGVQYSGGRAAENFKEALCSAFKDAPSECEDVLGAKEVAAQGSC